MQSISEGFAKLAKRVEDYAESVKNKGALVATAFGAAWLAALGLLVYGLYKL